MSNQSNENDMSGKFKTAAKNSTPQSFGGPVRFPYIAGGGSPISKGSEGNSFSKAGNHQYSASQSSNYAIGVGKTSSSSNLKATVSGGNFTLTGGINKDKREIIEYKCSPTGGITQVAPSQLNNENESHYNHFYHKFRQQNKGATSPDPKKVPVKIPSKNKFPLPFTGIEYPFIDGGGITS